MINSMSKQRFCRKSMVLRGDPSISVLLTWGSSKMVSSCSETWPINDWKTGSHTHTHGTMQADPVKDKDYSFARLSDLKSHVTLKM